MQGSNHSPPCEKPRTHVRANDLATGGLMSQEALSQLQRWATPVEFRVPSLRIITPVGVSPSIPALVALRLGENHVQ